MIIDVHVHAFPAAIRDHRERFFDGEPAFELLYASAKAKLVGADRIIDMMDAQQVDHSVIFGFPWRTADTFKRNNDYILEMVSRHPGRLSGFCCLDPMHPDAPAEAERCLQAGLAGVGELAFYCSDLDCACLDGLEPIMALCRRFDRPVMVHTNEPIGHAYPGKTPNTLAQIYALVKQYTDNRIILAHWGGGIFLYNLLKKQVRQTLSNVWYDTAASPFLYHPDIYLRAVELAGVDKILFGTDYPLLSPRRYFDEMVQAGLDTHHQERIIGGNAAALLKLADRDKG
jgi:predicted TIM-barrel fold metal-dependent hydrolase